MKKIVLILLMMTTSIFAQKNINSFKYVIVPEKFDFLKKTDQYQTSSLTKFLFNKSGFTTFLNDEALPNDVATNRCLALTGIVKDDSSMFTTKSIIELRDCNNNVIYTSKEGKSKEKEYKKAYHEAIRNAFKSVEALNYKYIPSNNSVTKVEKAEGIITSTPKVIETVIVKTKKDTNKLLNTLYAQSVANGFQLVDTTPKIIFQAIKTNVKDVYILKDKNGILYKNRDKWVAEFYENNNKIIKNYQIKF